MKALYLFAWSHFLRRTGIHFAGKCSSFLFEHDLFRPSFARRSGLREGGKPVPTPGSSPGAGFFGIML
jgi:hypothetical protein